MLAAAGRVLRHADGCGLLQVHEAIMRAPSDEVADGTVLQEFRRGFKIGGQLLRPAMVQVRSGLRAVLQPPKVAGCDMSGSCVL
jgi:GrpE